MHALLAIELLKIAIVSASVLSDQSGDSEHDMYVTCHEAIARLTNKITPLAYVLHIMGVPCITTKSSALWYCYSLTTIIQLGYMVLLVTIVQCQ